MSCWKYMGVSSKAQQNKSFKTDLEILGIEIEAQQRGGERMFK